MSSLANKERANKEGVLATLQCAFESPQLDFCDIDTFRQHLASGFQEYSTAYNALYMGAHAATPGMAFLSGYQSAIRCLDPACPADVLAAFCVSEKGVKKPWDMATHMSKTNNGYFLNGQKGYVMLLPNELDRMYIVAKTDSDQLCCLYLPVGSPGISATEVLVAPFVEDIPHSGVSFDHVQVFPDQLLNLDGHQQANKPFRYWEDVHVALAMMAWMVRKLSENGRSLTELEDIINSICQLIEKFEKSPAYYSHDSFALLDESHTLMEKHSSFLPSTVQKIWKKDRLLLQMGQKIRQIVKMKMGL